MISKTLERFLYTVDRDDLITYVSREWLDFAGANDAGELTADYVLGKPIWHFITGVDTQSFYHSIFRNLRRRASEIVIPFRCDSPAIIRQMDLTLRLLPDNAIELEGKLLKCTPREPITILFRYADRTEGAMPICAICRRLSVEGEWLELRNAVIHRLLMDVRPAPRLEETVCPTCNCVTE
jgi:hypothetical protein